MEIRGLCIFLDTCIFRDCRSLLIPLKVKSHVETSTTATKLKLRNNYQLITLLWKIIL